MKGLLFLGDSFTWGQGLHLYSDLPDIFWDGAYWFDKVTLAQYQFIKANRFSRLVANHFSTFDKVKKTNGGSNYLSINEFKTNILVPNTQSNTIPIELINKRAFRYNWDDFSYCIFQFTDPYRDNIEFEFDGIKYSIALSNVNHPNSDIFMKFISEKYDKNIKKWEDEYLKNYLSFYENELKEFEYNNIKVFVLSWPHSLVKYITQNEYLNQRYINIEYDNNIYISLDELIRKEKMCIGDDEWFGKNNKPKVIDGHLSLDAHKIIAKNIIKKIEEYEQSAIYPIQRRII